jgi:hypothetical protein
MSSSHHLPHAACRFQAIGPYVFKLSKLDKEGAVLRASPRFGASTDPSRHNVAIEFAMPIPGVIEISVCIKGEPCVYRLGCRFEELLDKMDHDNPGLPQHLAGAIYQFTYSFLPILSFSPLK